MTETEGSRESVVYILGAGFSAPLGLPVVGNFLERARDLYALDTKRNASFRAVFEKIDWMLRLGKSYRTNVHNIEEVLSLLSMERVLGRGKQVHVEGFICDVLEQSTPDMGRPALEHHSWHNLICAAGRPKELYLKWTLGLLHPVIEGAHRVGGLKWPPRVVPDSDGGLTSYSIITLNYDDLIERCFDSVFEGVRHEIKIVGEARRGRSLESNALKIAKLHGSVRTRHVVPPTWSKSIDSQIEGAWKLAGDLLRSATQIRVLGYSLPDGDSHFRQLLKFGAMHSPNLKRFDVVCLDDQAGSVEARYRALVALPMFRFRSVDVLEYLSNSPEIKVVPSGGQFVRVEAGTVEVLHARAFGR